MAWPAYKTTVAKKFEQNDEQMLSVRKAMQSIADNSLTRDIPRRRIVEAKAALENLVTSLDAVIAMGADAQAYAVAQYGDGTLNVSAEYNDVRTEANSLAAWIESAIPDNTDLETYDAATGSAVDEVYTSAQLAQFRTNVATFIATIATA